MQEKLHIKKNILKFIEYKGISRYEFYKKTGITRGVLDQNNGMSEENTATFIAYYPEVSIDWLITGNGNMLRDNNAVACTNDTNEESPSKINIALNECKRYIDNNEIIKAMQQTIEIQQHLINCFETINLERKGHKKIK